MYTLLSSEHHLPLLDRLLSIRGVFEDKESFLNPRIQDHRGDPFDLNDMDKGTDLLIQCMKARQSICVFGDYDVDGVTSSFLMYTLLHDYLHYPKVKIKFPDRLKDGYGMKVHHVDEMKAAGHEVIITVDNGITSIQEVMHAKNLGMTVIITDHHHALEHIPIADAIINPQVSDHYDFKGLCGAGVVLKFASALLKKSSLSDEIKQSIMNHFIPIVAIATVADCVPLLGENRSLVKRGLAQMTRRSQLLPALNGLLDFVNISGPLQAYHIGFIIGPRINAGGRLATGYDSIKTLLLTGEEQIQALKALDDINTERKKLQQQALDIALEQINLDHNILVAMDESFHEGIVGIVAGRITEKYNKPSIILHISHEKNMAVGSLRGPAYFHVMKLMQWIQSQSFGKCSRPDDGIFIKYGGHQQAGGMSIPLADVELFQQLVQEYGSLNIRTEQTQKTINVDTIIHAHERNPKTLDPLQDMEPFGQKNEEPVFAFQNTIIKGVEKVGSRGKGHLKLTLNHEGQQIESLYRSKGDRMDEFEKGTQTDIIGKIKFDNYKQSYYIDGTFLETIQPDDLINEEEIE